MHIARNISVKCLTDKMSIREIATMFGVAHSTVGNYKRRLNSAKIGLQEIGNCTDQQLEKILKLKRGRKLSFDRPQPDFEYIHKELKRKGVTIQLLWEEYKEDNPDGYQRARYSELYRDWRAKLKLSLRQTHEAGRKMFVDFSGMTVKIKDPKDGTFSKAEIFTAVLGASNYTYVEATADQTLASWTSAIINAFEFYNGVSSLIIPDNLKSAVTKACLFEPKLNRTHAEMCMHYGTTTVPARSRKPKDKGIVENSVQIAQRWILARLRNHTFFNLVDLNIAIKKLLKILNEKPFKVMKGSRIELFKQIEQPALMPLPPTRFEYAQWTKETLKNDYHVKINEHFYSVPYRLVGRVVHVRYTNETVEIFHGTNRVASHIRDDTPRTQSSNPSHMPENHRHFIAWTVEEMLQKGEKIGSHAKQLIGLILELKTDSTIKYRQCHGIFSLAKTYSDSRVDTACIRAIKINGLTYGSVKSILENGLDGQPLPEVVKSAKNIKHKNIRGFGYFNPSNEQIEQGDLPC